MGLSVTINKKRAGAREIARLISALQDSRLLQKQGGFLFKTTVEDGDLHFGIIPYIIQGERGYHYDIPMKLENEYTLIGSVTPSSEFSILIKPKNPDLSDSAAKRYRHTYIRFALFLIDNGYRGKGILDLPTRQILSEIGVSDTVTGTLGELATSVAGETN